LRWQAGDCSLSQRRACLGLEGGKHSSMRAR
jgi:hypothetical protein